VNAYHGVLVFACHIMGLVNRAIQYDRRCTEKPFLLDRHSLLVWRPSIAADMYAALQHMTSSERRALI
jgi:hypothetical protein